MVELCECGLNGGVLVGFVCYVEMLEVCGIVEFGCDVLVGVV